MFSDFKKVVYIDRRPPQSALDSIRRTNAPGEAEVVIRSIDFTADAVHVFANCPQACPMRNCSAMLARGKDALNGSIATCSRERSSELQGNTLAIVTFEISGNSSIKKINITLQITASSIAYVATTVHTGNL